MQKRGGAELRQILKRFHRLYVWIAVFSLFMNLLMLTGPIYMMQVYDRVLSSKSEATLVALSLIVVFLYAVMGGFDIVRGRILARIAGQFQGAIDARVFDATLTYASAFPQRAPHPGLRDVDAVQRLLASPAVHACFDMPWTPLFLLALWVFHPLLFALAFFGGVVLICVSIANQKFGAKHSNTASVSAGEAHSFAESARQNAETVHSMGMVANVRRRWSDKRADAVHKGVSATDVGGTYTSLSRTLRLMLQSAMLGVGAWLVLQGNLSAGAMIAASVLLGRALAPIEALIGQWPTIQRGIQGWRSLGELLEHMPETAGENDLASPAATLDLREVTVIPPGERQAVLRMINFNLRPGHACGVIGPSGAGKSSLAKTLTGVWPIAAGSIQLGGQGLDRYSPDALGQHVGYLPQTIQLFDGTIAENIARLEQSPDLDAVKRAAKRAGAWNLINALPNGFQTEIRGDQDSLSGGQLQRIGLARALYGDPAIVILDEPNANLDNDGNIALNQAIADLKKRQKIVLVMAHRPAAIQECDVLLMIENGARKAFGPKEQVLRKVVNNHSKLVRKNVVGGTA